MSKHWHKIIGFNDGHRYFERTQGKDRGRIGIGDQSGFFPDETDDGVLWLDQERPIVISMKSRNYCSIPLVDPNGGKCSTVTNPYEALRVAETFQMQVVCGPYIISTERRSHFEEIL